MQLKITIMKKVKIIIHPITLIICFLLILISGEHLGGFYLLYILLGLPHGADYSIFAIAGMSILLFNYIKYKSEFNYAIEPILNIAGLILLVLSLFLFFYDDKSHYNYSTFYQTTPMIIMSVFIILIVSFLVSNLLKIKIRRLSK
jgi:hypothetical protein